MDGELSLQRETLQEIQKTAVQAAGARDKIVMLPAPGTHDRNYFFIDAEGNFTEHDALPPIRKHVLNTLADLADFVNNTKAREIAPSPVVWYNTERIVAILDDSADSYRADSAACRFAITPSWSIITTRLAAGEEFQQRELIRLLKVQLVECLDDAGVQFLNMLRRVSFRSQSIVHGKSDHGRESMGKEVEQEVMADAGDVPEALNLHVRIFNDPGLTIRRTIRCAIEINVDFATFKITPIGTQIEDAINDEMEHVDNSLSNMLDCPVFYGTP